ncbi:MAG: hypothetical protein ACYCQJ_03250 [Nitrososphaerales archaeon]
MMKSALARAAGALFVVVSAFNLYIALYDKTLSELDPLHHSVNWAFVVIDLVCAALLLARPRALSLTLAGILWPLAYIFSLFVDIETRLCLGTNINCWPSALDSYDYLILGSASEGWLLWPYTMRVVIVLLVLIVALASFSLVLTYKKK